METNEFEQKKWELKLNKDNVTVYLKKGGSKYNSEQPYIMSEVIFNSYYSMGKLIHAVNFHQLTNSDL